MADWAKIKREYVRGGISYQQLCDKYKVPLGTMKRKAGAEGWVTLRDRAKTKTELKLVEDIAEKNVNADDVYYRIVDKLMAKIDEYIENHEIINGQTMKSLTSAIKDLKDIRNIKSEADIREQEARIAKLRKEAEREEENEKDIVVKLADNLEEYSR